MAPDLFHARRRLAELQKQPQTPEVTAQIEQLQRTIQDLEASAYTPSYSRTQDNGLVFSGPEFRDTSQTSDDIRPTSPIDFNHSGR